MPASQKRLAALPEKQESHAMKTPPRSADAIADLIAVARDLRDKNGGCPWDIEQTHESLAKHLLEESSELIEVIEHGLTPATDDAFKEELGDVLFQVVIHAQLAAESGRFTFSDVARGITDKLIVRHPHVYGDVSAETPGEVLRNWEAIKAREREKKQQRGQTTSYLDGVPKILPALQRAERLGEKAARVGFDWPEDTDVRGPAGPRTAAGGPEDTDVRGPAGQNGTRMLREKINEELKELDEVTGVDQERMTEEFGDLLFALAQYGRRLGIDSEGALRKACTKFETRFRVMEGEAASRISSGEKLSADEWDRLWRFAKETVTQRGGVSS
ncbi:MAG: nucleoside triphosphate pyrophosphohydrolase [Turneriella sp.]